MDRLRTERNTVSTFRWWTVVADGCASFKQIDAQVKKEGEISSTLWWWFVAADGSPSFKDI